MSEVTVAEVIVDALRDLGINIVFALPGTHIYHVFKYMDSRVKPIITRHESNAVYMADGYSRVSGRASVAIVTAGPGFLNALSSIAHSLVLSNPVIVISGDVSEHSMFEFHGLDSYDALVKASKPLCKSNHLVNESDDICEVVGLAYHHALSGRRGSIHLSIPYALLGRKSEYKPLDRFKTIPYIREQPILSKIIGRFLKGKILTILGPEASYADHRDDVIKFINAIKSPVISQPSSLGFIPQDSEYFAGYIEKMYLIHPVSKELVREADSIIFMGIRRNTPEYNHIMKLASNDVNIIHILPGMDIHIDFRNVEVDIFKVAMSEKSLTIAGYLPIVLNAIIDSGIESKEFSIDWVDLMNKWINNIHNELDRHTTSNHGLHQGRVLKILNEYIPMDSIITTDAGGNEVWARDIIGLNNRVRYLYVGTFGAIGYSLPAAVGASYASNSNAISIVGDGSMMMSIMELQTISYYEIPVKIFILNDSEYGMLRYLSRYDLGIELTYKLGYADFSKIAESFGLESYRVSRYDDLESVASSIFKSRKPIVVDIICEPTKPKSLS